MRGTQVQAPIRVVDSDIEISSDEEKGENSK